MTRWAAVSCVNCGPRGVDVHAIVDRENPTGRLVKEVQADGRTGVVYYRRGSAGSRLSVTDVAYLKASAR